MLAIKTLVLSMLNWYAPILIWDTPILELGWAHCQLGWSHCFVVYLCCCSHPNNNIWDVPRLALNAVWDGPRLALLACNKNTCVVYAQFGIGLQQINVY
jgi:hypothetical protein